MASIIVPPPSVGRDPMSQALVDYFDQEKFLVAEDPISICSAADLRVLEEEWGRCESDFSYASRNYFWITTKQSGDVLLRLNEAQELVLEAIRELWAKGRVAKIIILKARQLGMSTLIEALIAWSTMFRPNINALVVSKDRPHSAYLFSMLLHIYDQLPWWLRPMVASRERKDGLVFDNPDIDMRRLYPGLHSRIDVQAATDKSGAGEGRTLQAVHVSELGEWLEQTAEETIEGDLKNAIPDYAPQAFAAIESTAKGAGSYYDELYSTNEELAERGMEEWKTIFIPWFFEKQRFVAPEGGWRPDREEVSLRAKILDEWTQCDSCGAWKESKVASRNWSGLTCPFCKEGTLHPYSLTDGQLRYIAGKRIAASKSQKAMAEFRQELPSTATEAFQTSGYNIFPTSVQDFVDRSTRNPILEGFFDSRGMFHSYIERRNPLTGKVIGYRCFQPACTINHEFDDHGLKIWELPIQGRSYSIGADVSDGLGQDTDYSVAFVNRLGAPGSPDVQVAVYRSNEIDPVSFAAVLNYIGRWYNEALLAIEVNFGSTCADTVRLQYQYPNLFRWTYTDSMNVTSNKLHWVTTPNSKPRLYQTARKWLLGEHWYIKSENCSHELKKFQRDPQHRTSTAGTGAARGFKDDEIMAGMISLYCAHHLDFDENVGSMGQHAGKDVGILDYEMECKRCHHKWYTNNPNQESSCPAPDPTQDKPDAKCGCPRLIGRRVGVDSASLSPVKFDDMGSTYVAPGSDGGYHE